MADNSFPTAADEIGGVLYQRVKVTWGPDATANDADVATGKPLPVQLRGSDGTDRSNALPVTLASVPSHAVTNAGTFAVQATNTPLTNFGAGEYETVAASQTAQTIGATGAAGDYLSHVMSPYLPAL